MKDRIQELKDIISKKKEEVEVFEKELHAIYLEQAKIVKERTDLADRGLGNFKEEELIWAATQRCVCGAGLAYPNDIGVHGYWDCSDILMGKADVEKQHTGKLPFMFYEIKSDHQPSAYGATTRPIKKD